MPLVLGIAGSPRRGGNTEILLDAALDGAREAGGTARKVVLSEVPYSGCTACGWCHDGRDCILEDGLRNVYGMVDEADIIILASPIYFEGLSSWMKALIDRGQVFWERKYRLGLEGKDRRGAVIAVGARKNTDFTSALRPAKIWLLMLNADMVPLTFGGFDEKGSISDDPDALREARALGSGLVSDRAVQ